MEVKYTLFQQHLCSEASTQKESQQCLAHKHTLQAEEEVGMRGSKTRIRDTQERKIKHYFTLYTYQDHCIWAEQTTPLF